MDDNYTKALSHKKEAMFTNGLINLSNGESEDKSAVLIMSASDMPLSKATDTTFALIECTGIVQTCTPASFRTWLIVGDLRQFPLYNQ